MKSIVPILVVLLSDSDSTSTHGISNNNAQVGGLSLSFVKLRSFIHSFEGLSLQIFNFHLCSFQNGAA